MATATKTAKPAAAFDFGSVSVADAELPKATRDRGTGPNPFVEPLAESFESGKGKSVTIPGSAVKAATNHLRRAANSLGCGVRIVYTVKGEVVKIKDAEATRGNVTVMFAGKARKAAKADKSGE